MADSRPTRSETEAYREFTLPSKVILRMIARAANFIARDFNNELTQDNISAIRAFSLVVWGRDVWSEEIAVAEQFHPITNRLGYLYRRVGLGLLTGVMEQLYEVDQKLAQALRLSQETYLNVLEIMSFGGSLE